MNEQKETIYKAIFVKKALHQRIKVEALAHRKTMNDYLFYLLENDNLKKDKKTI